MVYFQMATASNKETITTSPVLTATSEQTSEKKTFPQFSVLSKLFLHKPVFHILLIFLFGLVAYSNTFHVPFQFDDINSIVENSSLRALGNLWPPVGSRWFGFLTFALNYCVHGFDVTGYHIVNLAVHIVNAVLVYFVVILSYKTPFLARSPLKDIAPIMALFSGMLFISHPIQTQAVTYIVQRFTSLATMLYLLSLVLYIKARLAKQRLEEREQSIDKSQNALKFKSVLFYLASALCSVLAMKTKEISFTLPLVIALYELLFFNGSMKRRLLYLMPLFLGMLIIPLTLVAADKPLGDLINDVSVATYAGSTLSRWEYLFTQFRVIVTYIRLLFLPINLNLDYDYPVYHTLADPEVLFSFLFLAALLGIGAYLLFRSRASAQPSGTRDFTDCRLISYGIFWFFVTLSVESSFIPIKDVIFEHRLYLPSLGFVLVISPLVFTSIIKFKNRWPKTVKALSILLPLILIATCLMTYARNEIWREVVVLWSDVARKSPNKARVHNNLGYAYDCAGSIDKAILHFQSAVRLDPYYIDAYLNLGKAYESKGLTDSALESYTFVLKYSPNEIKAHNGIAVVYGKRGLIDKAVEHLQIAVGLDPTFASAHYNLGNAYKAQNQLNLAKAQYLLALTLNPSFADANFNIGRCYLEEGFIDSARIEFEKTLLIDPNYRDARQLLESISR